VHGVEVDIDTKSVHVTYDEDQTSVEAIKETLAQIGYPAA
jgi:copper chaperone CopZ